MIRKIYNKIKQKQVIEYLLWKLGLKTLVKNITKNYWNAGKNYEWIYYLLEDEKNLEEKSIVEVGSRDALDSLNIIKKFNFKKAYIFEPSLPGIHESLKNINEHPLGKRVTFFPFALGNENGLRKFFENTEKVDIPNIGASGFYLDQHSNEYKSYKVPVYKIDEVLGDNIDDFLLLTIDVEGAELEVIKNQGLLMSKFKYVCLEISVSTSELPLSTNLKEVDKALRSYGYNFLEAKGRNFLDVDEIIKSDSHYVDLIYKNLRY